MVIIVTMGTMVTMHGHVATYIILGIHGIPKITLKWLGLPVQYLIVLNNPIMTFIYVVPDILEILQSEIVTLNKGREEWDSYCK